MIKACTAITLLLTAVSACSNSTTEHDDTARPRSEAKEIVLLIDTPAAHPPAADTSTPPAKQVKKKNIKPLVPAVDEAVQQTEHEHNILPGYTRHIVSADGNNLHFKRTVKYDEDRSIGCSGGGEEITFTLTNPADTFFLAGKALETLNIQFSTEGGLYSEQATKTISGTVKATRQAANTWLIEMDIRMEMKNFPHNETVQRHIVLSENFIHY